MNSLQGDELSIRFSAQGAGQPCRPCACRTQITLFGCGTGSHPDDQVAIYIGGYSRWLITAGR
jgi:hypothetical protein